MLKICEQKPVSANTPLHRRKESFHRYRLSATTDLRGLSNKFLSWRDIRDQRDCERWSSLAPLFYTRHIWVDKWIITPLFEGRDYVRIQDSVFYDNIVSTRPSYVYMTIEKQSGRGFVKFFAILEWQFEGLHDYYNIFKNKTR